MKFYFLLHFCVSTILYGQIDSKEAELIQSYRKSLISKDVKETVTSLNNLIVYKEGETQYHIALGYIYQLQGKHQLANVHLAKGRTFVLSQLKDKKLNNQQLLDHVVALCFAGFEQDCLQAYQTKYTLLKEDTYTSLFDFRTIQQFALHQRQLLNAYFQVQSTP